MARHVPSRFIEKVRRVREIVDGARSSERRRPLRRLTRGRAGGAPHPRAARGARSWRSRLWTYPTDIAELCGDGAVPAAAAALVVHRDDARRLQTDGVFVDLSQLVRSESYPGYYYALFDYASPLQLRRTMTRLVPAFAPHDTAPA